MTAYSDTDKAVRAIKAGATDFIPKPWEKEKLLATLSSALELRESRAEVRNLKKQVEILSSPEDAGFEIIGESEPMWALFRNNFSRVNYSAMRKGLLRMPVRKSRDEWR